MEIYLPTLETKMVALVSAFRFIVFAIMVVGLVAYAASARGQHAGLFVPLAKAIVIVAAVAYMDAWFPKVEQVFLSVAEYINPGYNENPTSASDTISCSPGINPARRPASHGPGSDCSSPCRVHIPNPDRRGRYCETADGA